MSISFKTRTLVICAYLGTAVGGLGGFASPVRAQDAVSPPTGGSAVVISAQSRASEVADQEVEKRVQGALHDDPYFYDQHVTVSVEKGDVVLRGFVFTGPDLLEAVSIASRAAGDRRVVDDLSIERDGQNSRH